MWAGARLHACPCTQSGVFLCGSCAVSLLCMCFCLPACVLLDCECVPRWVDVPLCGSLLCTPPLRNLGNSLLIFHQRWIITGRRFHSPLSSFFGGPGNLSFLPQILQHLLPSIQLQSRELRADLTQRLLITAPCPLQTHTRFFFNFISHFYIHHFIFVRAVLSSSQQLLWSSFSFSASCFLASLAFIYQGVCRRLLMTAALTMAIMFLQRIEWDL